MRLAERGAARVDDDDPLLVDAVVDQGLDGAAALGAVADDDDVVVHGLPPAGDPEALASLGGEHLERRADQQHQEPDAQRREDEGVDEPGVRQDRRDVAVAGRAQRDGRVVDRVDQVDVARRVGVVAVAGPVEVDQRDGEGEERQRQQDAAGELPDRRPDDRREADDSTGLLGDDVRHGQNLRHAGVRSPQDVAVDHGDRSAGAPGVLGPAGADGHEPEPLALLRRAGGPGATPRPAQLAVLVEAVLAPARRRRRGTAGRCRCRSSRPSRWRGWRSPGRRGRRPGSRRAGRSRRRRGLPAWAG